MYNVCSGLMLKLIKSESFRIWSLTPPLLIPLSLYIPDEQESSNTDPSPSDLFFLM